MTGDSSVTLLDKAASFENERKKLLQHSKELSHKLREALENEYREIAVGEKHFSPSDAARFVASQCEQHGWIPGPVKLGADITLTQQELMRFYALGTLYTTEEEQDARYPLPELAELPSERQFQIMVSEYRHLLDCDLTAGADRWQLEGSGSEAIEALASFLATEFSDDLRHQSWRPYAIVAGMHGGTEQEVWERLICQYREGRGCQFKVCHGVCTIVRDYLKSSRHISSGRLLSKSVSTLTLVASLDSSNWQPVPSGVSSLRRFR